MSEVFNTQSLLTINMETGYSGLGSATETKILYTKPSGATGFWTAGVSGTKLIYSLANGDIDQVGVWKFQAYAVIGGLKAFGAIKSQVFEKHL